GAERWHFDPKPDMEGVFSLKCRGVSYYQDSQAQPGAHCAARILTGTVDGRLLALDATDGQPCQGFGEGGEVDLKAAVHPLKKGEYVVTSPPQVVGDTVITGAHVADLHHADVPSGVVRAF